MRLLPELRLRFIFMTGEGTTPPLILDDDSRDVYVLFKPFDNCALRSVVFGLLRRFSPRPEA